MRFFHCKHPLHFVACFLLVSVAIASAQTKASGSPDLALVGGKVYASPTATVIDDAVIVISDGKIVAIGAT